MPRTRTGTLWTGFEKYFMRANLNRNVSIYPNPNRSWTEFFNSCWTRTEPEPEKQNGSTSCLMVAILYLFLMFITCLSHKMRDWLIDYSHSLNRHQNLLKTRVGLPLVTYCRIQIRISIFFSSTYLPWRSIETLSEQCSVFDV